jgi:hypothetical protein
VSVRSLGALAVRRRTVAGQPAGAAAALAPGQQPTDATDGLGVLEQAVPTEVIAFYTAVIAACETVLSRSPQDTYRPFRLILYVIGLVATAIAAWVSTRPAVARWTDVLGTPEWWTAILSFAAWGLAVPGSFLYVWLGPSTLTLTVASITALAALVIGVVLTPRLRTKEPQATAPAAGPTLVPVPGTGGGT